MLHTNFRENRPAGSGGEDFWRVFTIYWRGGHLCHVTQMPRTKYRSRYSRRLHIKFGFDLPNGFWEEDVWALWTTDGRTYDGRTSPTPTDAGPWIYYKLTYEPSAQVSVNIVLDSYAKQNCYLDLILIFSVIVFLNLESLECYLWLSLPVH